MKFLACALSCFLMGRWISAVLFDRKNCVLRIACAWNHLRLLSLLVALALYDPLCACESVQRQRIPCVDESSLSAGEVCSVLFQASKTLLMVASVLTFVCDLTVGGLIHFPSQSIWTQDCFDCRWFLTQDGCLVLHNM